MPVLPIQTRAFLPFYLPSVLIFVWLLWWLLWTEFEFVPSNSNFDFEFVSLVLHITLQLKFCGDLITSIRSYVLLGNCGFSECSTKTIEMCEG